jgi:hypothetical protein
MSYVGFPKAAVILWMILNFKGKRFSGKFIWTSLLEITKIISTAKG